MHVLAFKQSESKPDWHVIRLQEISGEAVNGVAVTATLKFGKAETANLVEEPTGIALDLSNLAFRPWETKTILVKVEASK